MAIVRVYMRWGWSGHPGDSFSVVTLLRHREGKALMRPAVRERKNGRKTKGPEGVRNKFKGIIKRIGE